MEKILEKRLIREIKKRNGWCLKWWPVSFTGLPDRIVLLPGAIIAFVELKSEGEKPKPRQLLVQNKLRTFGFKVYWINTNEQLNDFLNEL